MKTVCPRIFSSKNLTFLLILTLSLFGTACNKEADTAPKEEAITTEETLALAEAALAEGAEGIANEVADAVEVAELVLEKTLNSYCGVEKDSTLSRSFNTARLSGNYATTWNWILNCNEQDVPVNLTFNRSAVGTYESLRLLSDDQANSEWIMSNLVTGTAYTMNGTYQRDGTQVSKVRDQRNFSSTVQFTVDNLTVGKIKRQITGGTATLLISGQASTGETFSFTGKVTFLGDGEATVEINGVSYEIDLY